LKIPRELIDTRVSERRKEFVKRLRGEVAQKIHLSKQVFQKRLSRVIESVSTPILISMKHPRKNISILKYLRNRFQNL
jgi:hypothetical protein